MNIIIHELKKIWSWKTLAIVALLSVGYYILFLSDPIDGYPDGHPAIEDVALCTTLTLQYGPTLEADELEEFIQQNRETFIQETDSYIAHDPQMIAYGIHNYAELQEAITTLSAAEATDEQRNELFTIMNDFWRNADNVQEPQAPYMVGALDSIAKFYELMLTPDEADTGEPDTSAGGRARTRAYGGEEGRGIISFATINNTLDYAKKLAVLVVLVSLIALAPLLTTDRMRKVHLLQNTTKQGRGIVPKQLLSVLLSSAVLTTVLILVFGAIYAGNKTQIFWNNPISSFNSYYILTLPLTFGQYVLILIGIIYLLSLTTASIAFIISRFCKNYIALLAVLIPVLITHVYVFENIFFLSPLDTFAKEYGIALFEPVVCGIVLAIGWIAALGVALRDKRIDIV